ncbi:MAG: SH3 domain-containing protein, partial [Firmicutes bacterium]|nr:SH3 domain-containing protein [Bacillota bacterium]
MLKTKTVKRSLGIALIAVLFVVFTIMPMPAYGATTATGTITYSSGAYVRSQPTVNSSALTCLGCGTSVTVNYKTQGTDNSYTWYNITYGSVKGFVRSDLMSVSGDVPTQDPGSSGPTITELTPQIWQVSYPGSANLRKEPSTSSTVLASLATGTKITVDGKCASTNSSDSHTWYRSTYTNGSGTKITGFMRDDTITCCAGPEQPGEEDAEYVAELKAKGFPDTYIPYLVSLHKKYPSWIFTAQNTGLKWDDVLAKEN